MQTESKPGKSAIGEYAVSGRLGKGAMDEVWLGRHPDLDIPVAIKTLPPHLAAMGAGFAERFITEARTAARINHPNVVRVYDAGAEDDVQYIVMEFVEGGNVQDLLDANDGPLPPGARWSLLARRVSPGQQVVVAANGRMFPIVMLPKHAVPEDLFDDGPLRPPPGERDGGDRQQERW